ncbi:hypothetical protein EVAR_67481_1 [Eumeta japonica]|uniref:Uncharacterized protein n=1 Tax=Eumeta variegata TaxID=151549 RepID=A0A4C1ZCZ1_EUMVA|nr:hypothetical protein EVAR_67481_1 [Eumeta japonica]
MARGPPSLRTLRLSYTLYSLHLLEKSGTLQRIGNWPINYTELPSIFYSLAALVTLLRDRAPAQQVGGGHGPMTL